ncbi:response regulator [Dongshaea marina]|uniref:response regulator n=1 Tax=Dongshaea marina TaxID=2047966 RepID=UPI000D3E62A0|nr:response regulator [Dongshaea marina]
MGSFFDGKKLLLVDDQRAFQVMMKAMLQNIGLSDITLADNAEEALKICKNKKFDIFLVDYNLGTGRNGRQLLDELRQNDLIPTSSLFFIITGDNSRAMVLSALEMEPDDYLMKPFSQNQFLLRLQRSVEKKRTLHDLFFYLQKQDYPKVVDLCDQHIQDNPRYAGFCRCLRAEIHLKLKEPQKAIDDLEPLIEKTPVTWAKIMLGRAYVQVERFDDAEPLLRSVVRKNPLQVEAYHWLAQCYDQRQEGDRALKILAQATELSPQSINLQKMTAKIAMRNNDYGLLKESLSNVLDLSRHSLKQNPQYLDNYIGSLILFAQHSGDPYHIANLSKQVNTVLFKAKRELIRDPDFDFDHFEDICHARVQIARGDLMQGKKKLYKASESCLKELSESDPALISSTIHGLLQLGEFEYAQTLSEHLKGRDGVDSLTSATLDIVKEGDQLSKKQEQYNQLNREGIQAYQSGDYLQALECFRGALKKLPANTSAVLNKIQALIHIIKSDKKKTSGEFRTECRNALGLLEGLPLGEAHQQRFEQLNDEFQELK